MKTIYIGFNLLKKKLFICLLIVLEIMVSSNYLMPLLSEFIYYKRVQATVEKVNTENVYYLFTSFAYFGDSYLYEKFYERLQSLDYVKEVAEIYDPFEESEEYSILVYNDTAVNNLPPFLSEGQWLAEFDKNQAGAIPVVVAQETNWNLYETFSIVLQVYDNNYELLSLPLECVVVGILDSPTQYLEMQGSATEGAFKTDYMLGNEANIIILPFSQQIASFLEPYLYFNCSSGKLIYTNGYVPREQLIEDIGYYGNITDMSNGRSYFHTYMKVAAISRGYHFLIYALISLISVISLNIVYSIYNRKNFTIYYLCGMSKKQGAVIEATRIAALMLISFIGIIAYQMFSGSIELLFEPGQYMTAYLCCLAYIAIVFIPVSIGFIVSYMKHNIIDNLRELSLN